MVLTSDHKVMTSGSNQYGQLGHGDVTSRVSFNEVKTLADYETDDETILN